MGDIHQQYELGDYLQDGGFGCTYAATSRSTDSRWVVKAVARAGERRKANYKLDVQNLLSMDHPNIVRLHETFEDRRYHYLVFECCQGGALAAHIVNQDAFDERQAAVVMQQVLRGTLFIHACSICHRDLRLEGLVLESPGAPVDRNTVKISDFDCATTFSPDTLLFGRTGTRDYMAPEIVIDGGHNQACDLWSAGVILHQLATGTLPFRGRDDREVFEKICHTSPNFRSKCWAGASDGVKNLIQKLLRKSMADRLSAHHALNDPWIKDSRHSSSGTSSLGSGVKPLRRLRDLHSRRVLQGAACNAIAAQLESDDIDVLCEVFRRLDADADGRLTVSELQRGLQAISLQGLPEMPASPDSLECLDSDDDTGSASAFATIEVAPLIEAARERKAHIEESILWSTFCIFDRNGDGQIAKSELHKVLTGKHIANLLGEHVVAHILDASNANGAEFIGFDEFLKSVRCRAVACKNASQFCCELGSVHEIGNARQSLWV